MLRALRCRLALCHVYETLMYNSLRMYFIDPRARSFMFDKGMQLLRLQYSFSLHQDLCGTNMHKLYKNDVYVLNCLF